MIKRILILFAAVILFVSPIYTQYRISIEIPDLAKDTLLFGHYLNETVILKDTFFTDMAGMGEVRGSKSLPEGIYTVILPGQKRFDLIMGNDQEFGIIIDTLDLVNHTKIKGSEENKVFYEYLVFLENMRKEAEGFQKRIMNPVSKADSASAREDMIRINQEVKSYISNIIENNKGLFISEFLSALKEIEVPDPPRDAAGNIIDSTFQVKYYKNHYWDTFDLSDVRLLRTPLYEKKLLTYLDRWIYPDPDSIFKEVDWLISESRSDTLLFKYMLTTLFNHYAKSKYIGMDAVYAYIGEKYFIPEASWSDSAFIEKLKERVQKINPLVIGRVAPDIRLVSLPDDHFKTAMQDSALKSNPYGGSFFNLFDVKGNFIILYFWEPDCGHCQKTIPVLHEIYERLKDQGLEVVAVNMLGGVEGKKKWVDFVNEHNLYGWINAWNPYDYSYRDAFDVNSSNIVYLLDNQKQIVAKKISPEQAEEIINNELKKQN